MKQLSYRQTIEFNCRNANFVTIELKFLALSSKERSISLYGWLRMTQMNQLFKEPEGPLVLVINSCVNFYKNSCHLVPSKYLRGA